MSPYNAKKFSDIKSFLPRTDISETIPYIVSFSFGIKTKGCMVSAASQFPKIKHTNALDW